MKNTEKQTHINSLRNAITFADENLQYWEHSKKNWVNQLNQLELTQIPFDKPPKEADGSPSSEGQAKPNGETRKHAKKSASALHRQTHEEILNTKK